MTGMPDENRIHGNRWRVISELGKGGQRVVYLVVDAGRSEAGH
jgi:hypothetical protein